MNNQSFRSPKLGLWTLVALVVANMIGAGVFTSSGYSLASLGNPGRVMLAWWLCGLWAVCGAIAYGALVSRLPMSGGEYLFLSRFVHPSVGFLAGWISVFAGFTAPIALAAKSAAAYGFPSIDSSDYRLNLLAAGLILVATLCHWLGVSIGVGTQNGIVFVKLILLVVLIGWAFLGTSPESWQGTAIAGKESSWLPESWDAWWILAGSMSWVALSYTGFNAAVYVAEESNQAAKLVPRAMLIGTLLVTLLYLTLNYVFVYAPAPDLLVDKDGAGRQNVASIAALAVGGSGLETLVRITIVLSMTSSVFAMLMLGPRVYEKMAEDGVMPKFVGLTSHGHHTALIVQASLSIIAVFLGNLLQLMTYLGLTLSVCGALAVLSLWWVRKRLPDAHRLNMIERFSVSIYLLISFTFVWASQEQRPSEFRAMLFTFGFGLIVYAAWKAMETNSSATNSMQEETT